MSLFILGGGGGGIGDLQDYYAYLQFVKALSSDGKVLSIGLAQPSQDADELKIREKYLANELATILDHVNHTDRDIAVLGANPKTLQKQLELAAGIYVYGGDGDLLQKYFNFEIKLRDDVVVMGHSAGTNMWSTAYYSNDNGAVMDGLGVLPINTFCHYASYKWEKLNEIRGKNDLPIVPLFDGQYVYYAN